MKEREPVREKITKDEFVAGLLTKREKLLNVAVEDGDADTITGMILIINNALSAVEEACENNLKVNYYKTEDDYSYSFEPKKKMGFI
jgi:hypothetical protein